MSCTCGLGKYGTHSIWCDLVVYENPYFLSLLQYALNHTTRKSKEKKSKRSQHELDEMNECMIKVVITEG